MTMTMTNTQRLIAGFEHSQRHGAPRFIFLVGKFTGNGPAVVAALRRRGYKVDHVPGAAAAYCIITGPAQEQA